MSKTQVTNLRRGRYREGALNNETICFERQDLMLQVSFEDLFRCHYQAIREICERNKEPGLAMIAVDLDGVCSSNYIAASAHLASVAIVGRHGMTDLYLDGDPAVSLRHAAVILHPHLPPNDLRFRLVDLRSQLGLKDEHGRRLEALEAEGPVFARCGQYCLFFFPTGDSLPWPDDPEAGWACIPERVYFDEALAMPGQFERRKLLPRRARSRAAEEEQRTTFVQTLHGPLIASLRLLAEGERPLGAIQVASEVGISEIAVGQHAVRQGILLGRYERCDTQGLDMLENRNISRVHLLLLELAGQIFAIDTASTNGVFLDGKPVRIVPLRHAQRLILGEDLVTIRWSTNHGG